LTENTKTRKTEKSSKIKINPFLNWIFSFINFYL